VRELAKATLSFLWAMSLFGMKQMTDILTPQGPSLPTDKAVTAFDAVTYAAEGEFSDLLKVAFQAGDQLQREAVEFMFRVFTLEVLRPTSLARLSADTLQQAAETLRIFIPGESSVAAWQEFMNKLQVYFPVENVRSALQLPVGSALPLPAGPDSPLLEFTERAYARGAYAALWAVEGLGHYYGDTVWERHETPQHLLTDERVSALPAKSLLMLHAGIGLSFAKHLLQTVYPEAPTSDIRDVLQQFVTLCRNNSRTGYVGAAYESLGLVARTFRPRMVQILAQQLSEVAPEVIDYYWHGVGRALYFFPTYFVPGSCSPWQAAAREALHEIAWYNMQAGLAWAVTLVNQQQPNVVETLLKYQGDQLSSSDAFANGVMSSLMMRYDTTPDAPFITPFCQYQPDAHDPGVVALWHSQVAGPCQVALQQYYPVLKEYNRLDEIFRYQPLAELVERLQREPRVRIEPLTV
jgi:hypothetical protein